MYVLEFAWCATTRRAPRRVLLPSAAVATVAQALASQPPPPLPPLQPLPASVWENLAVWLRDTCDALEPPVWSVWVCEPRLQHTPRGADLGASTVTVARIDPARGALGGRTAWCTARLFRNRGTRNDTPWST